MHPASSRPRLRRIVRILLFTSLIAALSLQLVASRRQSRMLELLRVENQLLDQQTRVLGQQLEAERIQSAALARRLQAMLPATAPLP